MLGDVIWVASNDLKWVVIELKHHVVYPERQHVLMTGF